RVEPYLYFNGRCEEALEFYKQSIGAKVAVHARIGDVPGSNAPPGSAGKVMHAHMKVGDTTVLASDGQSSGATDFKGFSLSFTADDEDQANMLFAALAVGGSVQVPLMSTPFASRFGMVADQFGVLWTISSPQ